MTIDTKKLLIVLAAGVGLYLFATRSARAASNPTANGGRQYGYGAQTSPAQQANAQAAAWYGVGASAAGLAQGINSIIGRVMGPSAGTTNATRYVDAPTDSVPINPTSSYDAQAIEQQVYDSLLSAA